MEELKEYFVTCITYLFLILLNRYARMSSRGKKGKSAKKPKPTVKSLTKELEELTRVNDELKLKAETMTTEHGQMKARLDAVGKKIINFVDKEQFNVSESTDVLEISTETFLEMVSKIITRRSLNKSTLESRLEELETRVTHQSMQVAKLTQINLAYENAVIDLGKCRHMQEVNDIVDQIQILQLQTGKRRPHLTLCCWWLIWPGTWVLI